MEKTNEKYSAYIQILKEELIPAMGCTEPIALAYAAAVAKKVLAPIATLSGICPSTFFATAAA